MIAALFVEAGGTYTWACPDVDPWPKERDATKYDGSYPVVAHPPCNRWSVLAHSVMAKYGAMFTVGQDGGLFKSALASVERCGGVLEHPAFSIAWPTYDIARPRRGEWVKTRKGWTTEVSQSAYGHVARKKTWLYLVCPGEPPIIDWSDPRGTKQITRDAQAIGRLPEATKGERIATPIPFRQLLLSLARLSL